MPLDSSPSIIGRELLGPQLGRKVAQGFPEFDPNAFLERTLKNLQSSADGPPELSGLPSDEGSDIQVDVASEDFRAVDRGVDTVVETVASIDQGNQSFKCSLRNCTVYLLLQIWSETCATLRVLHVPIFCTFPLYQRFRIRLVIAKKMQQTLWDSRHHVERLTVAYMCSNRPSL